MSIRTASLATALALLAGTAVGHVVVPSAHAQSNGAPGTLSLDEIERRVTAQGIQVKEIEIRDLLVEVEGHDAELRKVKLMIDRRSGEVLSQQVKLPKHRRID
ncbi:PepSY domain-containing protein [Dokdonella sp. MW10]|uniref:PepSY domain-containing protein n=1 Tax=Dokdonella sp. MW10 TaxID=2992926 RepID=UPI003F7FB444